MKFSSKYKCQTMCFNLSLFCLAFLVSTNFAQSPKQENISFQNNEVQLSGILFLPNVTEKVPAVVILHGSGPDEGLEYKVYAEEFAKANIATLVFDKRGSGKSGGDWRKRPFELMANDALAAVKFLLNRAEISSNQIGLWGISQGSWTAAYAAARSKNVAFVISVAGNAVSPTQQEIWHKDQMYKSLEYSEKSRDTARKFWQMVFDWLVLVDEGKFPLPENVLESERSGGSIGLNYIPLSDWEKITQPVLLIHGDSDSLSPAAESISRITQILAKSGNNNFTYKIFPKASHTITTNKTGLEFDWDKHFAPEYFNFTTDWILSQTTKKVEVPVGNSSKIQSSPEFDETGVFGNPNWFGRAYPQLFLMIIFPIIFGVNLLISTIVFIRKRNITTIFSVFVCLINLLIILTFYIFLATSVFPQGMSVLQEYSIPLWQKMLPSLGIISLILTIMFTGILLKNRQEMTKGQIFVTVFAFIFVPWLYYWNLIGLMF